MSVIYARFLNQHEFINHTIFSASFCKINEEDRRSDETELLTNLNINQNLTENYIDKIDVESQFEHQFQSQQTKEIGWISDKIISMKISFNKTGEIDGSSYVKFPSGSNAISNIQNVDIHCFIWSILAYLHPCDNDYPNRDSNYKQSFDKLNIDDFEFTHGFKCSDVQNFEKLNNLSLNIFELNFYQDENKWKYNLIPIEISKNESDKVFGLLIYKNQFAPIKK